MFWETLSVNGTTNKFVLQMFVTKKLMPQKNLWSGKENDIFLVFYTSDIFEVACEKHNYLCSCNRMYRSTFLERMSKLSLNKAKHEEIPPTQDNFVNAPFEEEQIDFGLPVTNIKNPVKKEEDKSAGDFAGTISAAVKEMREKMDVRLAIVKAREGLAYGLQEDGHLPPFSRINLSCKPELNERTIFMELQEIWEAKAKIVREELLIETIEFLDKKLETITEGIKQTLDNAKEVIGIASKSAGEARKELTRRFLEMKNTEEKRLLEFKTDIRSRKMNAGWRKGGPKKTGARRFRPY